MNNLEVSHIHPRRPDKAQDLSRLLHAVCPDIYFPKFTWAGNEDVHFVIDDISHFERATKVKDTITQFREMTARENAGLRLLDLGELTEAMMTFVDPLLVDADPETTLLLFPGGGARSVLEMMTEETLERFPRLEIAARRIKDPKTNAITGISLPNSNEMFDKAKADMPKIETIVVFDDVIDSGKTLVAIQDKADIPDAAWIGASPILFSPLPYAGRINTPSSLPNFTALIGGLVLQGIENPVDLNSLTSFIEGGKKTERLVSKCLDRYVTPDNAERFKTTLQTISHAIYEG